VVEFTPRLEAGLHGFREFVHNLKSTLHSLFCLIERQRKSYLFRLVKTLMLTFTMVFYKGRYKKIAALFNFFTLAGGYINKFIKC
jgi:hypothetical protein